MGSDNRMSSSRHCCPLPFRLFVVAAVHRADPNDPMLDFVSREIQIQQGNTVSIDYTDWMSHYLASEPRVVQFQLGDVTSSCNASGEKVYQAKVLVNGGLQRIGTFGSTFVPYDNFEHTVSRSVARRSSFSSGSVLPLHHETFLGRIYRYPAKFYWVRESEMEQFEEFISTFISSPGRTRPILTPSIIQPTATGTLIAQNIRMFDETRRTLNISAATMPLVPVQVTRQNHALYRVTSASFFRGWSPVLAGRSEFVEDVQLSGSDWLGFIDFSLVTNESERLDLQTKAQEIADWLDNSIQRFTLVFTAFYDQDENGLGYGNAAGTIDSLGNGEVINNSGDPYPNHPFLLQALGFYGAVNFPTGGQLMSQARMRMNIQNPPGFSGSTPTVWGPGNVHTQSSVDGMISIAVT